MRIELPSRLTQRHAKHCTKLDVLTKSYYTTPFQSHEPTETWSASAPEIPSHTVAFLPLSSLPIHLCFPHKAEFSGFPVPPHRPLPLKQHRLSAVRIYLKTKESNRKKNCSQLRLSPEETGLGAHVYSAHQEKVEGSM